MSDKRNGAEANVTIPWTNLIRLRAEGGGTAHTRVDPHMTAMVNEIFGQKTPLVSALPSRQMTHGSVTSKR